jgi:hypothetical protein
MGAFLEGLTPRVEQFLRKFAGYFPPILYHNLARIADEVPVDRELLSWVRRDLESKTPLLDDEFLMEKAAVEEFLAQNKFTFVDDSTSLPEIATGSANASALYQVVGDYVGEVIAHGPSKRGKRRGTRRARPVERPEARKLYALNEVLYHIVTNYELAHALMSPLIGGVDLSSYLEIYLRGGDYVVGMDSIIVQQFNPPPPA